MNNILEKIVALKQKEIKKLKFSFDLEWFKFISKNFDRSCHSLKDSLKENPTGIIAEFKRRSPSKGWFQRHDLSAPLIVCCYENFGAAGASVLTDHRYFGGEIEDLMVVRGATKLPLLRKDFMLDEIQIQEAKAYGADVILLIAAILSPSRTRELAVEAKSYGMEVLLEIHDESELDHINDNIDLVGVNNRNLKTFETSLQTSFDLIEKIPKDKVAISESGITTAQDIIALRQAGFKGFLIGENFMKEADPAAAFGHFVETLKLTACN